LRAQNKITTEESTCLQDEKNAVITYQSRVQDKLTQVMEKGTGLFQGVAGEAASLGKNLRGYPETELANRQNLFANGRTPDWERSAHPGRRKGRPASRSPRI
jgi:hypothetical protein